MTQIRQALTLVSFCRLAAQEAWLVAGVTVAGRRLLRAGWVGGAGH